MIPALAQALADDRRYVDLPDSIRSYYTPLEFAWLSDLEKATLVQRETEPEWDE